LRLGNQDEAAGEFPPPYELTGYDTGGHVVAHSDPQALLPSEGRSPITTGVSIQSLHTDIVRAVISVGATDFFVYNASYATRVNIDDLFLTNDALTPPPAPTVTITSPRDSEDFTQPSDVTVSGHVTAPGRLSRFCLVATPQGGTPPATIPADCSQRAAIDASFDFTNLTVPGLVAGESNTITAFLEDGNGRVASAA